MKHSTAISFCLCLLPSAASAHGFAFYVSTPITPPQEFVWWFPISVALLVTGAFLILWRLFERHWLASAGLALVAVAAFAVAFFLFGRFAAWFQPAPPAGLERPHPTFWGIGWDRAGWPFIRWNLYGCGFLLASLVIIGGGFRTWKRLGKLALAVLILYSIGVAPYMATGALLHGRGGGYVFGDCDWRLMELNTALVAYAEQHDGMLPETDGMSSLLRELQPFLSRSRFLFPTPIDVCPLGGAFEREPQRYLWNTNFSGVSLHDMDPEGFLYDGLPIMCPYHEGASSRTLFALEDRVLSARNGTSHNRTGTTLTDRPSHPAERTERVLGE